ncbi:MULTISPECIES: hypothetical protein [unclassified Enterobacter]|jgi:hypothetical protein|uniref:hypothetical protein n=1 Tax=unclassified Enterobacter TaxID=2608935 RepID=UPI0015C9C548|nr:MULTISPECIES: hypothetical protein [unclassified Enterobacter]MBB3306758.1 hypothetical protein [Enterobacter sp. Sphag1F]NYI15917.1 hypothetical protein [Enterobacter sp. Sphag71]
MITDVIVRHATDIQEKNEIANFSTRYNVFLKNTSAISWELLEFTRSKGAEVLLKEMVSKLMNFHLNSLLVFVEFSAPQPKNAVVKHKKTWGLLEERGVNSTMIKNKKNYSFDFEGGLKLIGFGEIDIQNNNVIESLIKSNEDVFFALANKKSTLLQGDIDYDINKSKWMEEIIERDGIIFFPLGYNDDTSCEIVALGKSKNIHPLSKK